MNLQAEANETDISLTGGPSSKAHENDISFDIQVGPSA